MAAYGYTYRGYSTYDGLRPLTDDSSKMSYASSDHISKPLLVDAGGRKRPIISHVPNPNPDVYCFVTKTETTYDFTPLLSEYHRYSSPEKFCRPSSPVQYRIEEKHVSPAKPVRDHPEDQVNESEFLTNVQNEAIRPNRFSPTKPSYWDNTPNSYQVEKTGDLPNKERNEPSGNKNKHDASDDYYREPAVSETKPSKERNRPSGNKNKHDVSDDYYRAPAAISETKPTIITAGGWPRPSQAMWVTPPDGHLSQPTNDVGAAMGLIRQAAKVSGPDSKNSRYTVPVSTASRTNGKTEIIDSKEAQRRYGNMNFESQEKKAYAGTIDSRMAAKKYGGAMV